MLIQNEKILNFIIDSESFDSFLSEKNDDARRILNYHNSNFFNFIRSPYQTSFKELQNVPEFIKDYDINGNLINITTIHGQKSRKTIFDYSMENIEILGRGLNKTPDLSSNYKKSLLLVFIQVALNRQGRSRHNKILITNDRFILKNRSKIRSHPIFRLSKDNYLDIFTLKEAKEVMDLLLKYNSEYLLADEYKVDRGSWYLYSLRSKIPYFHVGALIDEPNLDAFSSRFRYLLRSIDEIGFHYYNGVNHGILEEILYHFNYSISLISGIFDALALITKNKYGLKFKGDDIPQRTSLNPNAGRDFLRAVRDKDPKLRKHLENYVQFIKIIYEMREIIIHRENLDKRLFKDEYGYEMVVIEINKKLRDYIRSCGDKKQKYKSITHWGVHETRWPTLSYLDPFYFIKTATRCLIEFSNKYLEMLGFSDFVMELENQNPQDSYLIDIKLIRNESLGF